MVKAVRASSIPNDLSIFTRTHNRNGKVAHVNAKNNTMTASSSFDRSSIGPVADAAAVGLVDAPVAAILISSVAGREVPRVKQA